MPPLIPAAKFLPVSPRTTTKPPVQPRPEALPGRSHQLDVDGVIVEALVAVAAGDLPRQHGPDGPVPIGDGCREGDRCAVLQGGHALLDEEVVESLLQVV